jgi:hypothetical protein
MAKSSIIKKVILWIKFRYHRWFKKEVPYIKSVHGDKYKYTPMQSASTNDILETWSYKKGLGEDPDYARMQASKAITRGRPEPGYEMPKLIKERKV